MMMSPGRWNSGIFLIQGQSKPAMMDTIPIAMRNRFIVIGVVQGNPCVESAAPTTATSSALSAQTPRAYPPSRPSPTAPAAAVSFLFPYLPDCRQTERPCRSPARLTGGNGWPELFIEAISLGGQLLGIPRVRQVRHRGRHWTQRILELAGEVLLDALPRNRLLLAYRAQAFGRLHHRHRPVQQLDLQNLLALRLCFPLRANVLRRRLEDPECPALGVSIEPGYSSTQCQRFVMGESQPLRDDGCPQRQYGSSVHRNDVHRHILPLNNHPCCNPGVRHATACGICRHTSYC